jgi:hypothetical protein
VIADCLSWDLIPTIFPFLLCRPADSKIRRAPLNREETAQVHQLLAVDGIGVSSRHFSPTMGPIVSRRCQLGQPVRCGIHHGVPVSALRLCASVRLIVDAISPQGRGAETVISEALLTLDKCAFLTTAIDQANSV